MLIALPPNIYRQGVIAGLVLTIGSGLVPACSVGAMFAGGALHRITEQPELPAAAASQQSWLCYSATSGWYWRADAAVAEADALIGWVVAGATAIRVCSTQWVGTPDALKPLSMGVVQPVEDTGYIDGAPYVLAAAEAAQLQPTLNGLRGEDA